jgi:hypothetical protein
VELTRADGALFNAPESGIPVVKWSKTYSNANGNVAFKTLKVGMEAPAPEPDPGPELVGHHTYGTIADSGSIADNARLMKDVGFKAVRLWCGYDPLTGMINNSKIAQAHIYLDAGIKVVLVLHPDKDGTNRVVPRDINTGSLSTLRKEVDVHILNEPNLPAFWPNGDWEGAWAYADRNSKAIRAMGYKTGTPSFAYQESREVRRRLQAMKDRGRMNFDKLVCHNYPTYDASYPAGKTAEFTALLQVYADLGLSWGMGVSIDEWGFYPSYTPTDIQTILPIWVGALNLYADESFYFIFGFVDKAPHRDFPFLVRGTTPTQFYNIFKEVLP